jgi:hypothetical protein
MPEVPADDEVASTQSPHSSSVPSPGRYVHTELDTIPEEEQSSGGEDSSASYTTASSTERMPMTPVARNEGEKGQSLENSHITPDILLLEDSSRHTSQVNSVKNIPPVKRLDWAYLCFFV